MITSLRAVGELQNSAIRDRHWDQVGKKTNILQLWHYFIKYKSLQLVQATRVKFTMSDDTTLSDLLSLNLHNFEDEVHGIVDKACKEMGMEKLLQDLQNVWKELNFDYEDHATGNNDANLVFLEHCVEETSRLQVDEDK